jgi:cation diffusion facilitator family transporter
VTADGRELPEAAARLEPSVGGGVGDPARAANAEKRSVALNSVIAAVFLTGMKIVVGFTTGSLGILSEAAHSALDLVAAVVTFFAVRVSGRPADREHTYGHGKVENLSALFETLLLLATCAWICYEAVERLFFKQVKVEATAWAFAVMAVSIIIDLSRSRALARVAKKHGSQALEADALHFSTDIWSSCVVLGGLSLVVVAEQTGNAWLHKADAVAALGVAVIVVIVSVRLGRRTIADLLDEVPLGLRDEVVHAVSLPGVESVGRVRLRRSGALSFVDLTLGVGRATSLERGHEIATAAEHAVQALLPGADVVVHVEPGRGHGVGDDVPAIVRRTAARFGLGVHDVLLHDILGERSLEMHVEVDDSLSVAAAHEQATAFEQALRLRILGLDRIVTHIEPVGGPAPGPQPPPVQERDVLRVLEELTREQPWRCRPHEISVRKLGGEQVVYLHCTLDAEMAITEAHDFTESVERELRERFPHVGRVVIHVEPPHEEGQPPVA